MTMGRKSMIRTIAIATLVAGSLDILSAFLWAALLGGPTANILPTIALGAFNMPPSPASQAVGLAVHFAIMTVMVTVYVLAARRIPALNRNWLISGLLYGFALWIVMYWIVMPLRWDTYQTPNELWPIVRQLISHCLLTGLPIAWITARSRRAIRPSYI
jgi:hypothetical protein